VSRDQSTLSEPPPITLEKARADGRVHGEMFPEYLRGAIASWRSAGFTDACLKEAEEAAMAAYRGK